MDKVDIPPPAEREPAIRKVLHYKGNNVDDLYKRYYFGPTYRADGGPGRVWKIRHAEYDAVTDVTTAFYAPVAEYELNAVIEQIHQRMG